MLKFREWLALREDDWGGAAFDGTWTQPRVNTPDYWSNSKYQGKGIRWDEPSDMNKIKKKYGKKSKPDDSNKPIEDRVPDEGKDERNKEEKEGDSDEKLAANFIRGESDPMNQANDGVRKVEKMYGLAPSYKLKN